jgi:signal transduction histidine kinase
VSLLGRIFGPSLGTRLGAGDLDDVLGDHGHRSELVEFRLVAAPLFIGAGALGLAATLLTVAAADPMPGFRPIPVGLIAVGGLVVGTLIATTHYVTRAWMIHLCGAFACAASTLASYWSGPSFGPYGAIFLILTAIALVMFLDRRGSLVLLVLIGLSYGLLLWAHHPSPSPVSRWVLLVGVCAVGAATVDALIGRLAESTRAEAAARRAAEGARAEADRSRALMEEASRHKSEFLANMSHELRTPLNAVIGFADVLSGQHFGDLNERQAEHVEDIRGAGQHLLALINDVLDLAKVEAGRMDIESHWFAFEDVARAAVQLVRPRADAGRLTLRIDVGPEAEHAYGDHRRIQQVLVNLLSNAVKFTPPGGVVALVARGSVDSTVVEVHDTGVGIAPEEQARVFDDFQQVRSAGAPHEGTGLGLALTKRFLELHGGEIWVRSEPGMGSTFGFRLPVPASALPGRPLKPDLCGQD